MDMDNADDNQDAFPVYSSKLRRVFVLIPLFITVFWISTQSSPIVNVHGTAPTQDATIKVVNKTNVSLRNSTSAIYNHSNTAPLPRPKNCTDNDIVRNSPVKTFEGDSEHLDPITEQLRRFFLRADVVLKEKYIIYDCSAVRSGRCGGWADRLSGIVTTFIISMITNRHFMINHDLPCKLDHYIVPNELDWRMNESRLAHKKSTYNFYNSDERIRETFRYSDLNKYLSTDVSYIRINWDYTVDFRLRKGIERRLPWLLRYTIADIEKAILAFLFQQSPEVKDSIKALTSMNVKEKTACAHIRIGKNPSIPNDRPRTNENALTEIWNVLKAYDQKGYTIYIMTDSHSVKVKARSRLRHFVYDTHKISHIDDLRFDCEGFRSMVLDFYLLQDPVCDVMVVGQSGFSIKAAFMRNTSNGMYCMRRNSVIPCSRYTLREVYPNWFRPYVDLNLREYQLLL